MKKIIFIIIFFLFSTSNTSAKTTLVIEEGKASIIKSEDVLGVSSEDSSANNESAQISTIERIDQILSLIPTKNKITVESLGSKATEFGEKEIDKLVLVEDEEGVELESKDGLIVITSDGTEAQTNLPVLVEQKNGKIYISKNNKTELLNLLPSDAKKAIEDSQKTIDGLPLKLILKEDNTEVVYEYSKEQNEKLFGIIPLSTKVTTTVSAQTGKVKTVNSSGIWEYFKNLFV